jgi:uncharacterized protein
MAHPSLGKLLVLQDRDQRFALLTGQLRQWPLERQATERDIIRERARVSEAENGVKTLEVQRMQLEGQVEDAEERVVKYRTQQLAVKKQDEYDALEKEVATLREKIDAWETEQLDLLDAIDHAQAALARVREEVAGKVATLEAHLRTLDEGLRQNEAGVGSAEAELAKAREEAAADVEALRQYDFVRRQVKRFPIIVPLAEGKCQGCHLRVPTDVESAVRKGTEIVRCASCGRILFLE